MKHNIVLLASHSRESAAKEKQYHAAAHALDLEVVPYPDAHTLGVFACSDFRSVDAANLAALHRVAGPDVLATTIATQKSLAYRHFARCGFSTLWTHAPCAPKTCCWTCPTPSSSSRTRAAARSPSTPGRTSAMTACGTFMTGWWPRICWRPSWPTRTTPIPGTAGI